MRHGADNRPTPAVAGEHEQRLTLTVDIFVPDHPDRSESPVFRRARKLLIEDNPAAKCWIDNSQCDGGLELHHFFIEWCDADGVDWDRVRALYPDFDWSTFKEPADFVDSAYNARLVLCKKHHTGKDHGIHLLPYPVWLMQAHKRADFVFSPDEIATTDSPPGKS
jgi:hypothetical protein